MRSIRAASRQSNSPQEARMPVTIGKFLRNVLYADILFSSLGALLMAAGAPFLSELLRLPTALLAGAGLVLIPWVLALIVIARRQQAPMMAIIVIAAINALWACGCFALLASDRIGPNALGNAFVVAQAAAVTLLAILQLLGLRSSLSEVRLPGPGAAPR
jgi:hypothetical protein